MVDLTEVLLTDGKVIKREADITLHKLSYRFGDFKIDQMCVSAFSYNRE